MGMYHKIIRKTLKISGWLLGSIIGLALLYFAAAWCCSRIVIPAEKGTPKEMAIYIKTNGMHTDIVVPVRNKLIDWSSKIPYQNNISQDTIYSYLGLGWGDKSFYLDMPTWDDLTFSLAFHAAFWLNTTAMHATYYKEMIEDETCCRIEISYSQYDQLINFISKRFNTDSNGAFINIPTHAQYGNSDAFYEAQGKYNLFYTCNTWSNNALAVCGQRHCLWTIWDKGIYRIYTEKRPYSIKYFCKVAKILPHCVSLPSAKWVWRSRRKYQLKYNL
jgi:uncharacterized protein (TIGR02117 family)